MAAPVNWGILGSAVFAAGQMGPAIHMARGGRLAALATRDAARAAPFSAFCPDIRVHEGYEALLADPAIDAVYIPLPNHLHVEWTLRALAAGKHVLCEKPLAMKAADFDGVIAARDASGLLAAEAYMIVFHPQWQRARALVAEGAIGRLVRVDGFFSYDNRDPGNIRNRPETGGGALPDIGVYILGATRFVTGQEPRAIRARIVREGGVDAYAHLDAEFEGFHYAAGVSMRMQPRQDMVFHGEEGLLRLSAPFNPNVFGPAVLVHERGMERREERWPAANHYVLQVEAFNASVRTGAAYPCPLEFSRGTQAAIDMAYAGDTGQG